MSYASSYVSSVGDAYFSQTLQDSVAWKYVDEEFPELPAIGQTRTGTYYSTPLSPVSLTRVPRSNGVLRLNTFVPKYSRSLEFWVHTAISHCTSSTSTRTTRLHPTCR